MIIGVGCEFNFVIIAVIIFIKDYYIFYLICEMLFREVRNVRPPV